MESNAIETFIATLYALRFAVVEWTLPGQQHSEPIYSAAAISWTAFLDGIPYPLSFVGRDGNEREVLAGASLVANATLGADVPSLCGPATYVLLEGNATLNLATFNYTSQCRLVANASTSCWILMEGAMDWVNASETANCTDCSKEGLLCCHCPWIPGIVGVAVSQIVPSPPTVAPIDVDTGFQLGLGSWIGLIALLIVAVLVAALLAALFWQQHRNKAKAAAASTAHFINTDNEGSDADQEQWLLPPSRHVVGVASEPPPQQPNMWFQPEKEFIL
jgi:hypothetical protein